MEQMMAFELGFIGLGKMGLNMVRRLLDKGKISVVVWNRSDEPAEIARKAGALKTGSVPELVGALRQQPRIVWLMLPSGSVTEDKFQETLKLLKKGDILIEGANSNFHDSIRRHSEAKAMGIRMLDIGVSGGIVGRNDGYALMIGGEQQAFEICKPIFEDLAQSYELVGPAGSGHYVKMIHNAIEYGMMQSIGEGFDLLENGHFKSLDLGKISKLWSKGTIISSFLMDRAKDALLKDEGLDIQPYVDDSGEGQWSSEEAMKHKVPFVANTYALHARYLSRQENSTAFRMIAALRREFGGHEVKNGTGIEGKQGKTGN